MLKTCPTDLNATIAETYPNLLEVHSGRLEVETRLREHNASDVELLQRICDTIKFVDEVPTRIDDNNWSLQNRIFLSLVGAGVLGFSAALLTPTIAQLDSRNAVALGWMIAFLALPVFYLFFRQVARRHDRHLALQRVPAIALSLAPLQPSSEALDRALNALRSIYCGLAFKISSEDILRAIKDYWTGSPRS